MQLRRTTWAVFAGATLVLAMTATAAGAATGPNNATTAIVPAAASGHTTDASGPIHDNQPPASKAKAARPAVHPAGSPAATYRQYIAWSQSFNVPAGASWWAEVYCPAGMLATGGGESNTSPNGFTLHGTYALSDGSGWHVDVTNNSSAAGLMVYTICFSGLNAYKQVTQPIPGYYSNEFLTHVGCPVGRAVGSGAVPSSSDQYVSYVQTTDAESWVGVGHTNPSSPNPTAQAICVDGINNYQESGYTAGPVNPGQVGSVHANCPSGTFIVSGGGGVNDGIIHFTLTDAYPTYPAQGWYVFARNDSTLADQLAAYLVCGN
jgi:hypothetical protein